MEVIVVDPMSPSAKKTRTVPRLALSCVSWLFQATCAGAAQEGAPEVHLEKLPLSFEGNAGQTPSSVDCIARGRAYAIFLTREGAVLALGGDDGDGATVRMSVDGAIPSAFPPGGARLPGDTRRFTPH